MKQIKNYFLIISVLISTISSAQYSGTHKWKFHSSYQEGVDIAPLNNKVYVGMKNSLIEYNTEENSYEVYDVTNYLSDVDITCVKSDQKNNLLIGYSNGNIDLLSNNTFYNLPELLNGNQIGNKKITNIHFDKNLAYISTGIGVVVYNISKREVKTFFNPLENSTIYDVTTLNDTIYVSTEQGLYKANKKNPFLADKNQWKKVNKFGALNNAKFSSIQSYQNKLYLIYDATIYKKDSLIMMQQDTVLGITASFLEQPKLSFYNNQLLVNSELVIYQIKENKLINKIYDYTNGKRKSILNATFLNNYYWIADKNLGLVKARNTWDNSQIDFNSPKYSSSFGIEIFNDRMVVAGGGLFGFLSNTYNKNGFYVRKNGDWQSFNRINSNKLNEYSYDFIGAAINQNNIDEYYIYGNSGTPIIKMNDNKIEEVFTPQNSTLNGLSNEKDVRIGGVVIDDDGALWVLNSYSQTPLKLKTKDGLWYETNIHSSVDGNVFYDMHYDYNGNLLISSESGLIIYDFGRNKSDFSDDQVKVITTGNKLPSNSVKSAIMDFDGEIWIGTKNGLAIIYNGNQVFEEEKIKVSQIIVQRNGEVDVLLGKNSIIDIELDGANRKWIALEQSGVVCLSPDGTEEIYNFNKNNSPLISNNVFDIEIDQITGEVYFATDKGLVSFRANATQHNKEMSNVNVFPNPVTPNFRGLVTISGLAYNSHVNITDVSGNLVYRTTTNGGTATWNCKTVNGERVATGVYLFWVAQNEGNARKVAKVMVIN